MDMFSHSGFHDDFLNLPRNGDFPQVRFPYNMLPLSPSVSLSVSDPVFRMVGYSWLQKLIKTLSDTVYATCSFSCEGLLLINRCNLAGLWLLAIMFYSVTEKYGCSHCTFEEHLKAWCFSVEFLHGGILSLAFLIFSCGGYAPSITLETFGTGLF